jgi:hypothetical protein
MLDTIFLILVGAFVGWNLPQPSWAKNLQDKFMPMLSTYLKSKIPFIG